MRASLLSTLVEDARPLLLSGLSSVFVALIAMLRLHAVWATVWLAGDAFLLLARLFIVYRYRSLSRPAPSHPEPWAVRYVPFALTACLVVGLGTMACVMSGDTVLAALAIMVTAGMLGGIASRNAGIPRLATAQIVLGTMPTASARALLDGESYWILVPPLFLYFGAISSVVRRPYRNLVTLMTAEGGHAEIAARFDAALAHMPHGLCAIDASGKVVIANRKGGGIVRHDGRDAAAQRNVAGFHRLCGTGEVRRNAARAAHRALHGMAEGRPCSR
ncbi:diguanylate cyclase/phosphodiesterase (GGDEF & EAL domain) with PAS/PAC sensor(s) [Candidatus Burkholderia pumila]|uniref:Diguanylate cyclase/phosphodiesterase (GGDEF & EAL domain) with PAS/PAC sensor(S) n=1 Tax=Candidatus Burkholderia pumila TaxID=1090375 RepID=A0ABR5HL67_9BURK|nr:diguanylate cyclase/phosphodiesterase (GGDEF & EAL domain) with PAS/PAC sensor(s) [Candidatus Burkholderia pumila]